MLLDIRLRRHLNRRLTGASPDERITDIAFELGLYPSQPDGQRLSCQVSVKRRRNGARDELASSQLLQPQRHRRVAIGEGGGDRGKNGWRPEWSQTGVAMPAASQGPDDGPALPGNIRRSHLPPTTASSVPRTGDFQKQTG